MAKKQPKYYVRPDGLHEAIRVINGKRVPFRGHTDAEVERKMIEYQIKQEKGLFFKESAEKWRDEHFPLLEEGTLKAYRPAYSRAIERFGDMYIREIMPGDIKSFFEKLKKQQFAKKTISNQRTVINLIFQDAVIEEAIKINPCAEVKIPKGLTVTERTLPTNEEMQIVKDGKNDPDGLLPYLLLYSGCRKGEALALDHKDIDRKSKIITINKSITYKGQTPSLKEPKTAAGKRKVILLNNLEEALPPRGIGLIFPGKDGGLMRQAEYERMWKRWQKKTGVTLTAHQLRHGFATLLYEAEIPEREAMKLMGHADITTMHKTYVHIRESRMETTAAKLNQAAAVF